MKKNIVLLNVFIFSFLYTQNIKPMVGIPSSGAMNPKKETMSIIVTYNTAHQFTDSHTLSKHASISASLLTSSGFEFKAGIFMKTEGVDLDYTGLAYHIKKRKYGVSLHFASYNHKLSDLYSSKPRETGISLHLRFRKKTIKPFIYYSRTVMYDNEQALQLFTIGATNMYNNLIFSTYITSQLEEVFNLDIETAQMNVTLGVLLN